MLCCSMWTIFETWSHFWWRYGGSRQELGACLAMITGRIVQEPCPMSPPAIASLPALLRAGPIEGSSLALGLLQMEEVQLGSKIVFSYLKWGTSPPLVREGLHGNVLRIVGDRTNLCWWAWVQACSKENVQPLEDGWLQQKPNRVCGTLEQEYFLLSGCKSVCLWDDPTSTFPPMHKSFYFLPEDSKQRPYVWCFPPNLCRTLFSFFFPCLLS